MQLLKDKVAVITGAGSGFGASTAKLFAEHGAKIVVVDINADNGTKVAREIKESGGEAIFFKANVANVEDIKGMINIAMDNYKKIDILYNNAGITHNPTPIEDIEESQYDKLFEINVKGVFLGIKYIVNIMKSQGGGVILNTSSAITTRLRPFFSAYTASKGAVSLLTKAMAVELAPYKIRVNAINPGAGDTGMLIDFMPKGTEKVTEEMKKKVGEIMILGRICEPIDVANVALFLASDLSSMITGVCLDVDGGKHL